MDSVTMKKTPLHAWHKEHGGKLVEFAGWEMPIQYASIMEEHHAVRRAAGLFDVSHMGQVFVEGAGAFEFLQELCTNDLARCPEGSGMYAHLCREDGGVIDDIFVYRLGKERFLVVVNASRVETDFAWMRGRLPSDARLRDGSDGLGMIALQGPAAEKIAGKIFGELPRRNQIRELPGPDAPSFLCRTGYTGEDGFEWIGPAAGTLGMWERMLTEGKAEGVRACGLGARDTLRLEAGFALYGNDLDEEHTPLESGPSWVVKLDKPHFIGKEALLRQKERGIFRKLSAFKLSARGVPRHGASILCDGKEAGQVTSGTFSPTLQCGIALGYVPAGLSGNWEILCNQKPVPAVPAALPFYKAPVK